MGLFSFLTKNKQESIPGDGEFYSRAEEDSQAARSRGKRKRTKLAGGAQSNLRDNAANEPVDPILPEKKRARRRLVGAAALVLAAIIGLPMILDSEPKPPAEDIAIQIPSKDKPLSANAGVSPAVSAPAAASFDQREPPPQASIADVGAAGTAAASAKAATPAAVPAPTAVAAVATPAGPGESASGIKEDVKPEQPVRAAKSVNSQTPEAAGAKAEAKAEAKATLKEEKIARDKRGEARAAAILDGKAELDPGKPNADKKPIRYIVQVAALASQDKVNELQGKLSGAGIKSYTERVPTVSGARIRVRIGPFASKQTADSTRAKLGKLGLNGTLVPS